MPAIKEVYVGDQLVWGGAEGGQVVGFKGVRYIGITTSALFEWTSAPGFTISSSSSGSYLIGYPHPYNPVQPIFSTMVSTTGSSGGFNACNDFSNDPFPLYVGRSWNGNVANTSGHVDMMVVEPEYGDDLRLETVVVDKNGAIQYSDTPGWSVSKVAVGTYDVTAPEAWPMTRSVITATYIGTATYIYGTWGNVYLTNDAAGTCRVNTRYATSSSIDMGFTLGVLVDNG